MRRGCQGYKLDAPCAGCHKCKRCVTFWYLSLDRTHPGWHRPQVVGDGDATESALIRGLRYLCQRSAQLAGATLPHVVIELKGEFHKSLLLFTSYLLRVAQR